MNTPLFSVSTTVSDGYNKGGLKDAYRTDNGKRYFKKLWSRCRRRISKRCLRQELELMRTGEVFMPKVTKLKSLTKGLTATQRSDPKVIRLAKLRRRLRNCKEYYYRPGKTDKFIRKNKKELHRVYLKQNNILKKIKTIDL